MLKNINNTSSNLKYHLTRIKILVRLNYKNYYIYLFLKFEIKFYQFEKTNSNFVLIFKN